MTGPVQNFKPIDLCMYECDLGQQSCHIEGQRTACVLEKAGDVQQQLLPDLRLKAQNLSHVLRSGYDHTSI